MINSLFDYGRLANTVKTEAPFRKREGEFPFMDRKFSTRWFTVEPDTRSFRIYNGYTWKQRDLTKEEYDEYENLNYERKIRHSYAQNMPDGTIRYFLFEKRPDELGILSPDGFLELTAENLKWGHRYLFNTESWCYYKADSRRGGVIAKGGGNFMLPICKSMRIRPIDAQLDPNHDYELMGKRVNRVESRKYMNSNGDFFKIVEGMMKASTMQSLVEIAIDLLLDKKYYTSRQTITWWSMDPKKPLMLEEAMNLLNDAPLDAAILFCLAEDCNRFRARVVGAINPLSVNMFPETSPANMFETMMRRLSLMIYKTEDSLMKYKKFPVGLPYPTSIWKYTFLRDGVPLEQYK